MNKLRITHFPQFPSCKPFHVEVKDIEEALKIRDLLANYDLFQFKQNIKPDYANMTTLDEYDEVTGEWLTWNDDDGLDLDDYIHERRIRDNG